MWGEGSLMVSVKRELSNMIIQKKTGVKVLLEEWGCVKCKSEAYHKYYESTPKGLGYKYECEDCGHTEVLMESYPRMIASKNGKSVVIPHASIDGFNNIFGEI